MRSSRIVNVLLSLFLIVKFAAHGQNSSSNPYTAELQVQYRYVKSDLIDSAEEMPADKYDFRPVAGVRTFGQIVGHLIDDQYAICALARGEKVPRDPNESAERAGGTKDQLVQGLRRAFEYCDAIYDPLTDVTAAERIRSYDGTMQPRIQLLMINTNHANLHYGNVIVYLRMNGIVPPSSKRNR
jgi:uncharacterized damage-inducible protein DinB